MKTQGFGLLALVAGTAAIAAPHTPLPDVSPINPGQHVVINIPQQRLFLYVDGKLSKIYPVAVGKAATQTDLGRHIIGAKTYNPTWHIPKSIQKELKNGKTTVPPGPEEALALKEMPFDEFARHFEAAFGKRLGALKSRGEAAVFPLQLKQLNKVYSGRVICIGNAAQTMHPVAAQGLNLGVRDALAVSRLLGEARNLNQPELAERYAAKRRLDARAIVGFTHSLVTLFDHPDLTLKLGRSGVMTLLDGLPAARKKFTEQLIFGL